MTVPQDPTKSLAMNSFPGTASYQGLQTGEPALEISHVKHGFGDKVVLDDVSLSLNPGGFLCLLGPSGCGKTTTLRLAAGLEHPWSGAIRINGKTVGGTGINLPPEDRHIGFLFQDFALFPHLNVVQNVMFGIPHLPAKQRTDIAQSKLEMVGMAGYASAYPHTLSGGQQQRVALARALAPDPGLVLLDEPFSGLDARLRTQIRSETFQVLKENGVAAVMVTHDPEEAMFMADTIALMDGGKIVQCDQPAALWHRPATPFAARFFGEINETIAPVWDQRAHTALGQLPAPGLSDGVNAVVMIRPEAIVLIPDLDGGPSPAAERPTAIIRSIRHLGPIHKVHLDITAANGQTVTLMAHIHDMPPVSIGATIGIGLLPDEVFVFGQEC